MDEKILIPKNILKKKRKTKRKEIPKNIFHGNDNSIPDKIIIFYCKKKINLNLVDETIKFKFKKLKSNIHLYKDEIKDLTDEIKIKITLAEKNHLINKIQCKQNNIYDIENDILLNKYIKETVNLIDEYNKTNDIIIAESYLSIAGKYIIIEKIKKIPFVFLCKSCSCDLVDLTEDIDGFYVCPECNSLNTSLKPNKYVKDTDNYNYNYEEDINNFIKIIEKFEGKNTIPIHDSLYNELDEYFVSNNMKKGRYYVNLPMLDNGKKHGTSRKKLWSALEKLGYNKYYDETSYIAHIYWGWKIPDLSLYKDQIIKDYQNTQQVWNNIKSKYKRSASLGTQYRLYVHLLSVNYPHCDRDDFKIQDMVDSLRLHNHAWEEMCKVTNINFYPVS